MPHPTVCPRRNPDSASVAAGQVKGSGGNVTAACHHVRPLAQFPAVRESAAPCGQSHSPASGPATWLAGHVLPSGLRDGEVWGGRVCPPPPSPPRPEGQRTRPPHSRGGGGWATRPHPSLRVTTLGSRSGSRPSAHSWSPNPRLCVLLFKDSAFCCRYSDDKSKSKSCSLSKV